jgi:hypothetical protein
MKKLSILLFVLASHFYGITQVLVPYLKKNGNYIYADSATMKPVFKTECSSPDFSYTALQKVTVYNKITKESKTGLINKKGVLVVPLKYDEVQDFKEQVAIVRLQIKSGTAIQTKRGCINELGKEIVPPKFDEIKDCFGGIIRVGIKSPEGKMLWGAWNKAGKEIIAVRYTSIDVYKQGLARIEDNGKKGVADKEGKIIVPVIYENVLVELGDFPVKLDGKWGKLDLKGKEIYPPEYTNTRDIRENVRMVFKNGKWGGIDKSGKEVISFTYDELYSLEEGLASAKKNGKWGYINKTGAVVIPFRFDDAGIFEEGLAWAAINGKHGLIDLKGNEIVPLKYDELYPAHSFRRELKFVRLNGKSGIINTKGDVIVPAIYTELEMHVPDSAGKGFYYVIKDDRLGILDETGIEIFPVKFTSNPEFADGLTPLTWIENEKEMFNYFTTDGKPLLKDGVYKSGSVFTKGVAIVNNGITGGAIDKSGKEIIPLKYEEINIDPDKPGFFKVKLSSISPNYFYIDRKGREYREK